MTPKGPAQVLAYDLGGTKVAAGIVTASGKILREERVAVQLDAGPRGLAEQMCTLGRSLLNRFPKTQTIGVASAGPLDPRTGTLLDPTNFSKNGRSFGILPLAKLLRHSLKRPVFIDNDAAAAILAECWKGAARGIENAAILTLGTGLGTGFVTNGKLVRAGRGLHPEGGHIIMMAGDPSALCGCGNFGCSEAYLSGNSFERRAQKKLGSNSLRAADVAEMARRKHPLALECFREYARLLATAIHNYITLFYPEIVILTGSFANASDLFLDDTREQLKLLLIKRTKTLDLMPKLSLSTLDNRAGLLGGAFVALSHTPTIKRRSFKIFNNIC